MVNYFDAKSFDKQPQIETLFTFSCARSLRSFTLAVNNGKYIVTEFVWNSPVEEQEFMSYTTAFEVFKSHIDASFLEL